MSVSIWRIRPISGQEIGSLPDRKENLYVDIGIEVILLV